jgi:hypothetical protein
MLVCPIPIDVPQSCATAPFGNTPLQRSPAKKIKKFLISTFFPSKHPQNYNTTNAS